ncbi:phosphatase PAP2 family protein [Bacillus sp. 2205SS5-2]|uniref:phosphatase PAP2 family protein n=1 Tax=Bacillus sp. 2205SS5-2 TaxID=3109031 RepID=UPI0030065698
MMSIKKIVKRGKLTMINVEKKMLINKTVVLLALALSTLIIFSWGFVEIVDELQENEIHAFDNDVTNVVRISITERVTNVMTFVTYFGGVEWITLLTLLITLGLIVFKKYPLAFYFASVNALGAGFNALLKNIFQRERPAIEHLVEQGGYSFPSGHSMGSIIFYGALTIVIYRLVEYRWAKVTIAVLGILFSILIGVSRIYLGVHFPSDVVGGFSAGGAWLITCTILYVVLFNFRKRI